MKECAKKRGNGVHCGNESVSKNGNDYENLGIVIRDGVEYGKDRVEEELDDDELTSLEKRRKRDFNDILSYGDKMGRIQQPVWRLDGFRQTVNFCELHDLGYVGNKFTWERGRGTD
uniref:Uncharacterized protein n=1 Tax=Solanum tuberosum TaxID=4113 RepID=M1DZC9_SOLTU